MMTRKDFKLIAQTLRELKALGVLSRKAHLSALTYFADSLSANYIDFDRAKFIQASHDLYPQQKKD